MGFIFPSQRRNRKRAARAAARTVLTAPLVLPIKGTLSSLDEEEPPMRVYDFAFSPNCRKVRAVAYELGMNLEYVHINLIKGESRTPAFLAKNPNGRVPLLEDGDLLLWESTAIMRYLVAKHGGQPSLLPTGIRELAEVDRWLAWQLAHLSPAIGKVAFERIVKKLTGQGAPDPAAIEAGTREFGTLTAVLDASLTGKEYVAGRLSVADFALAAHYSIAESCGLDMRQHPRANAWLERVLARDSMKRALEDARREMRGT
jgi:glutathione S-transferase